MNSASSTSWENFDRWACLMAKGEVGFDRFAAETREDFRRLARGVVRKKRLPSWLTIDDVYAGLLAAAWHNFYVRAGGFDAAKYGSAGAWIRWKARNRVTKDLSKAKGENQHSRLGPSAPEFLTKTGELPDAGAEADAAVECAIELKKIEKVCQTARDFVMLRAMAECLGEREAVVAFLLQEKACEDKPAARKAIVDFQRRVVEARNGDRI